MFAYYLLYATIGYMDSNFSISFLIICLIVLILVSALFSSSETAMMALNRYKLRHLAEQKNHRGAKRVLSLLARTDRLLTVILLGNTFANILASSAATILGGMLYGDKGILIATIVLTILVLLLAEIAPKTLAARFPQRYALVISLPLKVILFVLYPFVWLGNNIVRVLLYPITRKHPINQQDQLNAEELKTLLQTSENLSSQNQSMLTSILDLEKVTAEDLMVPKSDINGINLSDEWDNILKQLFISQHTRLPIYDGSFEQLHGLIHIRDVFHLMANEKLTKDSLLEYATEPYFIPESAPLHKQLLNFQQEQVRTAFVVDEYGTVQGLLALEDILEEIIGEYTTNFVDATSTDIESMPDGSYIIDGSTSIRTINRQLQWQLPTEQGKTLNGLVTAHFDGIPDRGVCIRIGQYGLEILRQHEHVISSVSVKVIAD